VFFTSYEKGVEGDISQKYLVV